MRDASEKKTFPTVIHVIKKENSATMSYKESPKILHLLNKSKIR